MLSTSLRLSPTRLWDVAVVTSHPPSEVLRHFLGMETLWGEALPGVRGVLIGVDCGLADDGILFWERNKSFNHTGQQNC